MEGRCWERGEGGTGGTGGTRRCRVLLDLDERVQAQPHTKALHDAHTELARDRNLSVRGRGSDGVPGQSSALPAWHGAGG